MSALETIIRPRERDLGGLSVRRVLHRDSLGCTQLIRPGEANWMTAGSGLAHSERAVRARAAAGRGD